MRFAPVALATLASCAAAAPFLPGNVPEEETTLSSGSRDGVLAAKPYHRKLLGDVALWSKSATHTHFPRAENVVKDSTKVEMVKASGFFGGFHSSKQSHENSSCPRDVSHVTKHKMKAIIEGNEESNGSLGGKAKVTIKVKNGKHGLFNHPLDVSKVLERISGGKTHPVSDHPGDFMDDILAGKPNLSGIVPDDVRGVLGDVLQDIIVKETMPECLRNPVNSILDLLRRRPYSYGHHLENLDKRGQQEDLEEDIKSSSFLGNLMTGNADLTGMIPGSVRNALGEVLSDVKAPEAMPETVRKPTNMILDTLRKTPGDEIKGENFADFWKSMPKLAPLVLDVKPKEASRISGRSEGLLTEERMPDENWPTRPQTPGSASGLIDRRSRLRRSALPAEKPPVEHFRPEDYQSRVLGFDRLNEGERLRQVAAMRAENPSMKVRQKDIDRFTRFMINDALSNTEEEFCAIVVKIGIKEFDMVQEPKQYWYPMCQAKYKEYNDWYDEYKHDPDVWEAHMEREWEMQLDWTLVDWVRIEKDDRKQTGREAAETAAKARFQDLMEKNMPAPGSKTKRSKKVEGDEDRPLEPKLSKWTKFTDDMSSLIGIDLRNPFGQR